MNPETPSAPESPTARDDANRAEAPDADSPPEANAPWYRDGLAFACTRCGACCTGAPGYVWVVDFEIQRLADHLGLPLDQFARRYLRRVGDELSLVEKPNGDCVFWDREAGCTVYPARPVQCRTWPFWPENIDTPRSWDEVRAVCPGSGAPGGTWHSLEAIEAAARRSVRKDPDEELRA